MTKDIIMTNEKNEYLCNKETLAFSKEKSEAVKLSYAEAKKIKGGNSGWHLGNV